MNSEQKVVVRLADNEDGLWRQFASHTNEMVICKGGRKMFPPLDYEIEGLDPRKMYEVVLEIHQVDDFLYTYWNGEWMNIGPSKEPSDDANEKAETIQHFNGVKSGEEWMAVPVSFDHIKLCSNLKSTNPLHAVLRIKHKYVPVLSINEVSSADLEPVAVVRIEHTQFIAVSRYQNDAVRSLKIALNPLSQQHREGSRSLGSIKKKRRQPSSSTEVSLKQKKFNVLASPSPLPAMLPHILPIPTTPFFSGFVADPVFTPNFVRCIPPSEISLFSPAKSLTPLSADSDHHAP